MRSSCVDDGIVAAQQGPYFTAEIPQKDIFCGPPRSCSTQGAPL